MCQNLSFTGVIPVLNQTGRINHRMNYNFFASTTTDAYSKTINSVQYPASDLQLYIQPSVIFVQSPNLNFSGSYTYQRNNPFNSRYSNEHRIWEQIVISKPVFNGRFTNRFRFEERFIQNRLTNKYPLYTRLRYQIGFNTPLRGKTLDKGELYLNLYNEFYFSTSGPVINAFYSENWSYLGIGYDIGKLGRLEMGYLLQYFVRNKNHDLRILNLAQVMWVTNFNFKKKK